MEQKIIQKNTIAFLLDFDYTVTEETQQIGILKKYWNNIAEMYSRPDFLKKIREFHPNFNIEKDKFEPEKYFVIKDHLKFGEGVGWLQQFVWDWNAGLFPGLTIDNLPEFGKEIKLSQGMPEFIPEFKEHWRKEGINVLFYVVSVGLEELVRGSKIGPYLDDIFASRIVNNKLFCNVNGKTNENNGYSAILGIGDVMTPYGKTETIYIIRKGKRELRDKQMTPEEYLVYSHKQIICVGDGDSDQPIITYTGKKGAQTVIVYEDGNWSSFQKAFGKMDMKPNYILPRNYKKKGPMWTAANDMVKSIINDKCLLDPYDLHQYRTGEIADPEKREYVQKHLDKCSTCSHYITTCAIQPQRIKEE